MQILSILIDVVGPVFLSSLVGYVWALRGAPFDPKFVAVLVTGIGTPCLVIDSLSASGLQASVLGSIALAAVLCLGLMLVGAYALVRLMGLPVAVYVPALTFPNTGNMGLPLGLFAFGQPGLALAIGYFAVTSFFQFTLGQGLALGRLDLGALLRMPLVWAVAVGLGLAVSGVHPPQAIGRAVHILGGLTVPLMLLSLGYSLARLKLASLARGVGFSLARLFGGFAAGWLVATALGLDGVARGVIVAQSSMPSAVYNYMFAERFNNQPEEVAGIVIVSTLLAVVLLPLFLATVM